MVNRCTQMQFFVPPTAQAPPPRPHLLLMSLKYMQLWSTNGTVTYHQANISGELTHHYFVFATDHSKCLLHTFIRTSNFGAEAECSYYFY